MPSDSEHDSDYAPQNDNDVSSPSSSDSDNQRPVKRLRTSPPKPTAEVEEALKKTEQDRVWHQFKSAVAQQPGQTPKLVKIQKRYRFAGEEILEITQVPAESEDAKKWPLWSESGPSNQNAADIDKPPSISPAPPALANENSKQKAHGPRKPKLALPSLSTPSQPKAKKLTTLDKSSIDWKTHLISDGATTKDELEANRRSGGYLGKIEFLQRVSERKDSILEENQAKKRRR